MLSLTDIERIRRDMEEARARRLQPHHIEGFFRGALTALHGRIAPRQRGRFEITHVPQAVREGARCSPATSGSASTASSSKASRGPTCWGQAIPCWTQWWTRSRSATRDVLASGLFFVTERTVANPPGSWPPSGMEVVDGHEPPRPVLKRFGYVELYADGQTARRTPPKPPTWTMTRSTRPNWTWCARCSGRAGSRTPRSWR